MCYIYIYMCVYITCVCVCPKLRPKISRRLASTGASSGGWWLSPLTPLKNMKHSQLGWWHYQLNGKIKNVPNHQSTINLYTNLWSVKIYESICSIHPNEAIQIQISNQRLSDFGGRVHIRKLRSKYFNMGNNGKEWWIIDNDGYSMSFWMGFTLR